METNSRGQSLTLLQNLVEELLKACPDPQTVQRMMQELGLPVTNDPLSQMSTVLNSLDSFCKSQRNSSESPTGL